MDGYNTFSSVHDGIWPGLSENQRLHKANKMQLRETTQQKPMSTVLNDQIHNDRRANKSEAFKVVIVVTYQSRYMGNL